MHSHLLVSGLPRSLPPLPPSPAPPCLPCIEGRQRAAPHSSSFPPTTAPLQTLHMDVWGPARVSGQGCERYFLLVVEDYTRYTTVFPLRSKGEVPDVLIPWIRTVRLLLRERFHQDLPVLRLHSDRGGEFSSDLLRDFCRGEGIHPVYAAHQLNLWPRVSLLETSPTLRWTGKVGDASVFRVWGSRAFVRDTSVDKLSARAIPCVFLGFVPNAPGWQFYHPTSRRVLPSQDVMFDESVPFYRLFPYCSAPPPPPLLFLAPGPPQVAVVSGAARSAASGGAASEGAEPGGAGSEGARSGGAEARGAESEVAESGGAEPQGAALSGGAGDTGAGGDAVPTGIGGVGYARAGDPMEPGAAGTGGTGAGVAGVGGPGAGGARAAGARVGGTGAGGAGAAGAGAVDPGAGGAGDTVRTRLYFVPLLQQVPDPASDRVRTASPTVARLLATAVTDPSFESAATSAPVAELLYFSVACRLDYATALVAESESASPPSVRGECALGTDVLEDRQEDFECLEATVPCFASLLLAPEGDPDAPDILTPHSYAEAITGPYSSQWQAAMDAEMASWKSTGTYVDAVPLSRANIVDGMWIFRVKQPPGSLPAFKTRYVARGFSQRQGVDYFQTFSPTPKMTTLWPARGDLAVPTTGFHWDVSCRTTLVALGFAPSTVDPSLFLRTDTSLPPFYVLVYVDDLVFATADTEALTLVKSELQKRHTCTDLGELHSYLGLQITWDRARRTITLTQSHMVHQVLQRFGFQYSSPQLTPLSTSHSLSAPPSDESVERSGRHRKVHWDAAKRLLRYLCSTSGMGLMLGGRGPVVLTGHADASWVDDSAMQQSSQGYTLSLGSSSVSWRYTRSSLVLSSSCEAEIYAKAMATQELR
ncbi:unnamed protein product [Closterium sp. NIES-54]